MDNYQTISLTDLRFYAYHGVEPQERIVGAEYSVNVTIYTDVTKAAQTDNVKDTINYASIALSVKKIMNQPKNLLESVANSIIQELFSQYRIIKAATVTVSKLNPPVQIPCSAASVTITLSR
ncbi:MAG: dihydroneopterin aldolase [Bacteroidaceae bacterium]|nr:dihydroneopterin aldolase [Bacteroidaceae bacterium]